MKLSTILICFLAFAGVCPAVVPVYISGEDDALLGKVPSGEIDSVMDFRAIEATEKIAAEVGYFNIRSGGHFSAFFPQLADGEKDRRGPGAWMHYVVTYDQAVGAEAAVTLGEEEKVPIEVPKGLSGLQQDWAQKRVSFDRLVEDPMADTNPSNIPDWAIAASMLLVGGVAVLMFWNQLFPKRP